MEIVQIKVPLDQAEMQALVRIADRECRHPNEQLRFFLREEAKRRGLLAAQADAPVPQPTVGASHAAH